MPDIIICPSCGENNLPDQEFCQYCQTRLQPLTGPLKGADAPIKPGQVPTKKNTAELEPILPQWLRDARDLARKDDQQAAQENLQQPAQSQPASSAKDLLAGLQSQAGDVKESDLPDWLASITGVISKSTKSQTESSDFRWVELGDKDDFAKDESAELSSDEPQPDEKDEVRDWFRNLGSSEQTQQPEQPESIENSFSGSSASDTPDLLRTIGGQEETANSADSADYSETGLGEPPTGIISESLKSTESATSANELPDWLSSDATIPPSTAVEDEPTAMEDVPFDDIEDESEAAALQSPSYTIFEEKSLEPAQEEHPLGWLDTFQPVSAHQPETPIEQADFTPLDFTEDSQVSDNLDELFIDIPDGLSSASEVPRSSIPTADTDSEVIAPDDLPSWVEAMRPVDHGISQLSSQTLESGGALAGLAGVLPAAAGFAPMSKPNAYSIKSQASEEHQAQAALLEQMLTAETAPVPMASFSVLRTSRRLRWFLTFTIFIMIAIPLFLRTQMFSLPVGIPLAVNGALQVAQSIPEDAPVLVAFDYEPARVGEMEAAAAPMFDQMILLRHPHLTFISTNETGAILVERFISGPLAVHNYQSGIQYLNLGYLPGGQMGIRAFAQNPQITAPFDMSFSAAWDSAPLEGVNSLSQFAALIVVTDNADAARTWIEQTESARGGIPFVVISSAQAAPMIQPYYESQQISGLVSGLYGGALFEQYNAGRPGTARSYWDAFSLGMLLAMALVLGGGLWNFSLGLRDRAAAGEAQ
ncbi:MAG: hypothetical protein Q8O48_06430 [Anaerolineales bacterium]|nr:hypothetical protein [Anaerolineales bacterium]